AGAVWRSAAVRSKVDRYAGREAESAAVWHQSATAPADGAGGMMPCSRHRSSTVAGRSPPSRWSCSATFGSSRIRSAETVIEAGYVRAEQTCCRAQTWPGGTGEAASQSELSVRSRSHRGPGSSQRVNGSPSVASLLTAERTTASRRHLGAEASGPWRTSTMTDDDKRRSLAEQLREENPLDAAAARAAVAAVSVMNEAFEKSDLSSRRQLAG